MNDIRRTQMCIDDVLRTGLNLRVTKPNYFFPEMTNQSLRFDDVSGEMIYYTGIKNSLENALEHVREGGILKKSMLPENAPKYFYEKL
ncbi:hypothetical protein ACFLTH_13590 [Bacteroidota bacterium]